MTSLATPIRDSNAPAATAPVDFAAGAACIDGRYMPIAQAAIPVTDWGYRRGDTAYDVVSVWEGSFFRLEDHLRRFRASMETMRLKPEETDEDIRRILAECVRLTGLREAHVAMDCLRGRRKPGLVYHPVNCRNYLIAFAIPYVWLMKDEVRERGVHLIVAKVPRIPESSVDQRAKNFNWGDFNRALFEAHDLGGDNCILLTSDGRVTEGPGLQRVRGLGRQDRDARPQHPRGVHAARRARPVQGAGAALRGQARSGRGVAPCRRGLHLDHGGRRRSGYARRRPHLR